MDYCIIHGIDLVSVHPMAFKVLEQDQQFFKKIFTPTEISYCQKKNGSTNQALSFASRLAAKGAVGKMLGISSEIIGFKNIEVISDEFGKPKIKLHGKAMELALKAGIDQENIALSMSHTDELVIASALALIQKNKEVQKMEKREKTARVKVIDEAAIEDAKMAARNIENLFRAISKEAGLYPELQWESVDYADDYLVITLRIDMARGLTSGAAPVLGPAIARFTARKKETLTLPSSITIRFYDKYRDRLDSFVKAAEKAAESFGVDIEIKVVKEL